MKKLLVVLSFLALMVFCLGSPTLASTAYLDYLASGTWDAEVEEGDLTGIILGVNTQLETFNLGLEYAALTEEAPEGEVGTADFTVLDLRGGYLVVNEDATKFAIGLGYLSMDEEGDTISGFALALDVVAGSDVFLFEGGLGYTLNATTDPGDFDVTVTYFKLRGTYLFSESAGVTLSYRSYLLTNDDTDVDVTLSGLGLGFTYKF